MNKLFAAFGMETCAEGRFACLAQTESAERMKAECWEHEPIIFYCGMSTFMAK